MVKRGLRLFSHSHTCDLALYLKGDVVPVFLFPSEELVFSLGRVLLGRGQEGEAHEVLGFPVNC